MYYDEYDQEQLYVEVQDEDSLNNSISQLRISDNSYRTFQRPPLKQDPKDTLIIMNIDVCSTVRKIVMDNKQKYVQKILIYGVNEVGNSFQITINGFVSYFYAYVPRGLPYNPDEDTLERLRTTLNSCYAETVQLKAKYKAAEQYWHPTINYYAITNITLVKRNNIIGYTPYGEYQNYLKLYCSSPNVINPLRGIFYEERRFGNVQLINYTFYSNVAYALRFMVDKNIVGMGWLSIEGGKYTIKKDGLKNSACQAYIECHANHVEYIECNDAWAKIAPLRIMSFDIECAAYQGFPSAEIHPIIQIACACKTTTYKEYDYKIVFVLNGATAISGVHLQYFKDERELLKAFEDLVRNYDPDFLLGYNIINFDLCYILYRAMKLKMKDYGHFGRSLYSISRVKKSNLRSKQLGNRDTKDINIDGRIQLDLLIHMQREHKLSSYSLNNVSYHFLKDQKEDVHHSEIYKLFMYSRYTRKRLAIYCLKDAELPIRLMYKLCCLYNYAEMARVTGVPINFLLTRGQQIKVVSQLLRKTRQHNLIIPATRVNKNSNDIGFDGAYVLDPYKGYYQTPIATLDFASLYPSIMIAYNLCYTTLLSESKMKKYWVYNVDYITTPEGVHFAKRDGRIRKYGLLPEILMELLAARKKAKKYLAITKDYMMRNVLDGRQLALKISANSVYGFTGAQVGHLPCLAISASVTNYGREMIEATRKQVLYMYPGSYVIYGDTDSVMVKFKLVYSEHLGRKQQIEYSMKYGCEAAMRITKYLFANFPPIKLYFEKVYCPYLLIAKKRYAGVLYTNSEKHDKIDKKGIESVRRDNCLLIREMLYKVLEMLLCHNDIKGVTEYIKNTVCNLVQNKIDISKLVITKAISKNAAYDEYYHYGKKSDKPSKNTYKVKQAHVYLAEKMKKRDGNLIVHIGDRIPYVMITGAAGSRNYENAYDPIKVLNEDLPIDYDYYINKQLKPPLYRLLDNSGIITYFDSLFTGAHIKNRYLPKLNKNNAIGKFITVFSTCINCPIKSYEALCERCRVKDRYIYIVKHMYELRLYSHYAYLLRECQNCQGSVMMEVICQNFDCPIFYRRIKVRNDLEAKQKQMEKFRRRNNDYW